MPADPDVVYDDATSKFWSFQTNVNVFMHWVNVPVRSSSDLSTWKFEGDALPNLPGWAEAGNTWAPGVEKIGGRWRLYFTARLRSSTRPDGSGISCIGVAHASSVKGSYSPASSPIVCQTDRGGSIDPSPFQDPATGQWWLHWKSDENSQYTTTDGKSRLWAAPLTGDGMAIGGTARVILTHEVGSERPLIENPTMIHGGGRYWLAYSANWWESYDYHDHLAACAGPAGPCSRIGNPYDPWLSKASGIAGPGGAAFFTGPTGNAHVVFHGWTSAVGYAKGGKRSMFVEPVTFDGYSNAPRLRPDLARVRAPQPLRTTLSPRTVTCCACTGRSSTGNRTRPAPATG